MEIYKELIVMSYLISIIIPIFNVEPFLKSALDSIVNQTFNLNNLEVLMVNDCSTDNSGMIKIGRAHV